MHRSVLVEFKGEQTVMKNMRKSRCAGRAIWGGLLRFGARTAPAGAGSAFSNAKARTQ
jgi:hypothetical protein